MANFSIEGEQRLSLFSMIGVLACLLGVSVLVLATMATVSLGAERGVQLAGGDDASESLQEREPTWVEWDGEEIIVHPQRARARFDRDLAEIDTYRETYDYMFEFLSGTDVGDALAAVSGDDQRFVVLLLRPEGFGTAAELRGYLEFLGLDHVAEPVGNGSSRLRVR